jgi:hypothetical protein
LHIEKILETLENNSYVQPLQFNKSNKRYSNKSVNENTSELSESDYTSSSSVESSDEDYDCQEQNDSYPSKYFRVEKSVNENCNKLIRMLMHSSSQK